MDDKRTLTVMIDGTSYRAAPLDQGQLVAIQLIKKVKPGTVLDILSNLIKASLGDDAHSDVVLLMAAGHLDLKGLMGVLTDLAKATADAKDGNPQAAPSEDEYPKIRVTDGGE